MTTADLAARYQSDGSAGVFRDINVTLSVQNVFNDKTDRDPYVGWIRCAYDSTNYSAVGGSSPDCVEAVVSRIMRMHMVNSGSPVS